MGRQQLISTLVLARDTLDELARHPAFADDAPEFNAGGIGYETIRAIGKALRQADKEQAAAPDLADALKALVKWMDDAGLSHTQVGPACAKLGVQPTEYSVVTDARAALAKAGLA